jgi:hypothetical protein
MISGLHTHAVTAGRKAAGRTMYGCLFAISICTTHHPECLAVAFRAPQRRVAPDPPSKITRPDKAWYNQVQ